MTFFELEKDSTHIEVIANWFYKEWAHLNPNRTLNDVKSLVIDTINDSENKIFVLEESGNPIATVLLRNEEVETAEKLGPWLSSLFVNEHYRHQGNGSRTIRFFEDYCTSKDIKQVYLFTEELENWYQSMGWVIEREAEFKGHRGTIMSKRL